MTDLTFTEVSAQAGTAVERLVLPFESRQKTRQRVALASGREAGLKLPRGTVLRGGNVIRAADGSTALVVAADEPVSTVTAGDPIALARAAYHLGNRHVWLQVGDGWLRYLADRVLDDMVRNLGVSVVSEQAPFEPEAGAYSQAHDHAHTHDPAHGQHHDHDHDHDHDHAHAPRVR